MKELSGKRFVLGVTGGVAAYKAAELARLLVKADAQVDVVLTAAGAQFIGSATFQALTGRPVWSELWDQRQQRGMGHIDLTRGADAIVVAPATADFLAKAVQGRADDLLSTLCLARECPLLAAPAMNRQMWENPATQRNLQQLKADGVLLLGPATGEQACGEFGPGRMLEAQELFDEIVATLQPRHLTGRRVLLTAGPTFEPLDPVRGLTNTSSGKMGFALARACAEAGAAVTLVAGPVSLPTPRAVRRIDIQTARDMHQAVLSAVGNVDIFISVAAVADYRPAQQADQKIKKTTAGATLSLELTANPDILAEVAALPAAPFCVGFAAESQNLATYAEGKRLAKKLPLVIGNLVQDGLGHDTNTVILFDASGQHKLPPGPKTTIARDIVAHIARMLEN
ncbi:MAG: bifunctional phosphopantothenoylcysteine decarboxylase/phosphopantothenate--cysteine ligase CoaBC [Sterolibacterium sp.]|nr:bifunctional phosphopantothenoylcysteine decarboxylase/phosphopantothenate--cysteine ligase CoaBC [Sterolibacterium sp.]MBP9798825.1 bifunctional phosphopantothenoylcysteine decarboxylase/phosphopantothenate--cysteine ligase CoaBC [Sterolibacterium sp.]